MKKAFFALLLFYSVIFNFGCHLFSSSKVEERYILSEDFRAGITKINAYFNENHYDSAEVALLQLNKTAQTSLEKYLIYCYQAEVMYYNVLPTLAKNNLDEAMEIAQKSKLPELISNCENYYGLIHILEKEPIDAQKHLHRALALSSKDSSSQFFVSYYQILANLAETHLMTNHPDSAIFYAAQSAKITEQKNIQRGSALNHWTLGQAYIQKDSINKAKEQFVKGLQKINGDEHGDVIHYLYAGLIQCALIEKNQLDATHWVLLGKDSTVMDKSSILGQTDFYKQASVAATFFGLKDIQIELEKNQLKLINQSRENELMMQSTVLSSYFEELGAVKQNEREKQLTNRFIQSVLMAVLIILIFVIYANRKILRQKIKINELESKSKIAVLTKEKEMSEIIARNTAIEEERTRISKELHDDIGSSISSIKIYNNLAQKQFEAQPEKAKVLLEKSGSEIKQIEESLGDLIWAVYTKNETIQNLIMRMKQYAFDVLSAKEIEAEFNYPYQLNDIKLPIEFRKNILLIFKEFVNNTAKYSGAKKFVFSIELVSEKNIVIKLMDNGVGFDVRANTGKGLSNMQGRTKAMNTDFELASSTEKGTILEINYHFE